MVLEPEVFMQVFMRRTYSLVPPPLRTEPPQVPTGATGSVLDPHGRSDPSIGVWMCQTVHDWRGSSSLMQINFKEAAVRQRLPSKSLNKEPEIVQAGHPPSTPLQFP